MQNHTCAYLYTHKPNLRLAEAVYKEAPKSESAASAATMAASMRLGESRAATMAASIRLGETRAVTGGNMGQSVGSAPKELMQGDFKMCNEYNCIL